MERRHPAEIPNLEVMEEGVARASTLVHQTADAGGKVFVVGHDDTAFARRHHLPILKGEAACQAE